MYSLLPDKGGPHENSVWRADEAQGRSDESMKAIEVTEVAEATLIRCTAKSASGSFVDDAQRYPLSTQSHVC